MTEILVGLDAKPGAQDALAFARRLAGTTGATLRVVSAYPDAIQPDRTGSPEYASVLERDARELLLRVADAATVAIPDPSPARALHHVAERTGAALVVVGSSQRGPVGRCPVLVLPRGSRHAVLDSLLGAFEEAGAT